MRTYDQAYADVLNAHEVVTGLSITIAACIVEDVEPPPDEVALFKEWYQRWRAAVRGLEDLERPAFADMENEQDLCEVDAETWRTHWVEKRRELGDTLTVRMFEARDALLKSSRSAE